jgi:hypothetical protein
MTIELVWTLRFGLDGAAPKLHFCPPTTSGGA